MAAPELAVFVLVVENAQLAEYGQGAERDVLRASGSPEPGATLRAIRSPPSASGMARLRNSP
ncbi:hypothetical protein [Streptomyces decoyicus]